MLPLNHLGSDSPLYFSLLKRSCEDALKRITRTVIPSALWLRGQLTRPQTIDRPCVSAETGTYTIPPTEYCSAKASQSASKSPREWIQVAQSVRQIQLANRTVHLHGNLRGTIELDYRVLTVSLLSPGVVAESPHTVQIAPLLDDNYCSLSGSHIWNSTEGRRFGSVTRMPVGGQQVKSDQIRRSTSCLKAEEQ